MTDLKRDTTVSATAQSTYDEMGLSIDDLLAWSDVLDHLSHSPNQIEPGMLRVIGGAINTLSDGLDAEREQLGRLALGMTLAEQVASTKAAETEPREGQAPVYVTDASRDPDAALRALCRELHAVKDWQNSCGLDDDDPRMTAADARETELCAAIASARAFTGRGILDKARVTLREFGMLPCLDARNELPDGDDEKLLVSLARDICSAQNHLAPRAEPNVITSARHLSRPQGE